MPTLTTRLGTYGKGSALSHAEMDANWKRPVTAVTSTPVTLTEAHNRNIIECGAGSGTLVLTAAATLAAIDTEDWFVDIVNTTSSAITIDPNGSETIDGQTTLTLQQYDSVSIALDSAKTGFIKKQYTKQIGTIYPVYGGRIARTSSVAIGSSGWDEDVFWGNTGYETVECISSYASGTLITVPVGVSYMRALISPIFNGDETGIRGCALYSCNASGGAGSAVFYATTPAFSGAANAGPQLDTGWFSVTPGDYYKGAVYNNSASVSLQAGSFIAVEFK